MIEKILDLSVRNRWFVVLVTWRAPAHLGAWSLTKLPIDAVPDVTNNQVQINAIAPALTPIEMEKQVTFPIETALAGTPGARVHTLVLAQRLRPDHGGLHATRPTSTSRVSR